MRLLIISHTPHFLRDGGLVGWGSTVREIDHLAQAFGEVRHVAFLHDGEAPAAMLPYRARNVAVVPLPPSGGERLRDKLNVLRLWPRYLAVILREVRQADVVHVRSPANVALIALLGLALPGKPTLRWVKYAGDWRPLNGSWAGALQRWWLQRGLHRGVVTINGRWPDQPRHINSLVNPCLTGEEVSAARAAAAGKELRAPVHLMFVGRVEAAKGVEQALRILAGLGAAGCDARMDVVGDGPQRPSFEELAAALGVASRVAFHGWMPRASLAPLYGQAHFVVLPSFAEGWPKVLSEGMAYGALPLASRVGGIPDTLERFRVGAACEPADVSGFVEAVLQYVRNPGRWASESRRAREAAGFFTYEVYTQSVLRMLGVGSSEEVGAPAVQPNSSAGG